MNRYRYFFIGMLLAFVNGWADCPSVNDITYVFKEDDWSLFQASNGWSQPMPTGADGSSLFKYAHMYATSRPYTSTEISKVKTLMSVVVKPDRVHCFYLTDSRSEIILEKKGQATIKNLDHWHRNCMSKKHYGCSAWKGYDCAFYFR